MSGLADSVHVYLILSAVFFICGIMAALTRKNAIGIFMGVELMLNGAALNFVAFQAFRRGSEGGNHLWPDGHIFSLFIVILAAIEAAVALAIVLRVYWSRRSINPDVLRELKG